MSWVQTLLSLVILVILSGVAHTPAVLASGIEVRSGPGAAYEVVATVPPGASYVLLAQEANWSKIELPDGREGWVSRIEVQQEPLARTPAVAVTTPVLPPPTAPPAAASLPPSAPTPAAAPSSTIAPVTAPPASRRTALVIGNAAYHEAPLRNAGHDAADMATTLRQLEFDVTLLQDVPLRAMEEAVNAFNLSLRQGGIGLFYFAGHGVQVDGENYLVPLDASIKRQQDVRYQALPEGRVLGAMEDAGNGLNVVILDACRNTPFTRSWRSSQVGLAAPSAATPSGMLIAYATKPGGVAADGEGQNGVYTKHLLQAMMIPGLSIELVFKEVRKQVKKETEDKQEPWESSSLVGDFTFLPAHAGTVSAVTPVPPASAMAAPPAVRAPSQESPGPATQPGVTVSPPSPSPPAAPQQSSDRAASQEAAQARPSPGLSPEGYTVMRRIYCEDVESGLLRGTLDLTITSHVSCEDAKQLLLVVEQERDNCRYPKEDKNVVDNTLKESRKMGKEWIGTASCKTL